MKSREPVERTPRQLRPEQRAAIVAAFVRICARELGLENALDRGREELHLASGPRRRAVGDHVTEGTGLADER
jgi:hypothetical protein